MQKKKKDIKLREEMQKEVQVEHRNWKKKKKKKRNNLEWII